MPPTRSPTRRRRWLALSLLLDVALMAAMTALDLRDLLFKTLWLGPDDSYSFTAVGTQSLRPTMSLADVATPPLDRSTTLEGDVLPRASGWTSFLAACDDVHPIGGTFFHHALGTNCSVGPRANGVVVPQLVFTAVARVDSIEWAACRLLRNDRRPVLCRAGLAQRFAERYNMAETPRLFVLASRQRAASSAVVFTETSRPIVLPESSAEAELLRLLDVVGRSAPPLSRLTCVEGFANDGPGYYTAHFFGCGSATRFEAAFVGHHATDYASLHQNKAFLTVDALQLLGMAFLIRQNSWSRFRVTDGLLVVEHTTFVNFSSSGMLYTFAVVIDMVLLLVNLASTLEIARLVVWPLAQELTARDSERRVGTREAPFAFEDYKAVLTSPLFRSAPVALLLLLSQGLCWMLVLPNAIIWTWTEAVAGKLQAYLSTLRIWVVPLILINGAWDVVVYFAERTAYAVTARTHITPWEAGAIACVVTFMAQAHIFAISGTKYARDTQRVVDTTSFQGLSAFGNGFAEGQDTRQNTPWADIKVVYGPLWDILAWTFAGIALCVGSRFAYHTQRRTPTAVAHHTGVANAADGALRRAVAVTPQPHVQLRPPPPLAEPAPLPPQPWAAYKRLPIETLLNLPLRARSLIRSTYYMETGVRGKLFLRPSCYVEHGIVMEHHKLRTRRGFVSMIQYSTAAASHAMPSKASATDEDTQEHQKQEETIVEPFDPVRRAQQSLPQPLPALRHRRRVLTPLR